jgi:nucleotide-binding universal stress UspA family protein
MTTHEPVTHSPGLAPPSVFERILIGVDGTKGSLDACRQIARLAEPSTTVEAAIVSLFTPATATALGADDLAERLEHTARTALTAAEAILGPHAELRRLQGLPVEALLDELKRMQATLLAIGPPEHDRIAEILLGGTGGELLHRSRCSMLLARPAPDLRSFPRSIVVGVDGSKPAARAYAVAEQLATRFHSELRGVVADGGKHVELDAIRGLPRVDVVAGAPARVLVESAATADLLVVGSRGLHGLRALGSVSERAAHEASCSVVVVR